MDCQKLKKEVVKPLYLMLNQSLRFSRRILAVFSWARDVTEFGLATLRQCFFLVTGKRKEDLPDYDLAVAQRQTFNNKLKLAGVALTIYDCFNQQTQNFFCGGVEISLLLKGGKTFLLGNQIFNEIIVKQDHSKVTYEAQVEPTWQEFTALDESTILEKTIVPHPDNIPKESSSSTLDSLHSTNSKQPKTKTNKKAQQSPFSSCCTQPLAFENNLIKTAAKLKSDKQEPTPKMKDSLQLKAQVMERPTIKENGTMRRNSSHRDIPQSRPSSRYYGKSPLSFQLKKLPYYL